MRCRFCGKAKTREFIDLGMSPLSNSYIAYDKLDQGEVFFPLKVNICDECLLVQLQEYESPKDIFTNYAYLSSYSDSWLRHAKDFVDSISKSIGLNNNSTVIELASNDGYLLQFFREKGIKCIGVEPAANVAEIAKEKGIETIVDFFGEELALKLKAKGRMADLIVANNVLAHVPDLNSFVEGICILLKDGGTVSVEFPYLLNLIDLKQFDTIYHEHYSYFSLLTARRVFLKHNLKIFKVEQLKTHGGSLRLYACHINDNREIDRSVGELIATECDRGADKVHFYLNFKNDVEKIKCNTLRFLVEAKESGKKICGYGAPAKGNTFLNYCGIGTEFIEFTVDKNPIKQNTFLPGTRIPVYAPEKILEVKPDYIVIFPWNIKDEIIEQEEIIRSWNGRFVIFIPDLEII